MGCKVAQTSGCVCLMIKTFGSGCGIGILPMGCVSATPRCVNVSPALTGGPPVPRGAVAAISGWY
jgi:hypothetical protein